MKEYDQNFQELQFKISIAPEIQKLIRDLQRVGDYEEEIRYCHELVDFHREKESSLIINSLRALAEAYSRYNKEDEALKVYKEIAEIYGENCPAFILDKIADKNQTKEYCEEKPLTKIDASESLNLRKGQRVPLTKNNPELDKLAVDIRWEAAEDLEINLSAFLPGADDKVHADKDFIFYNNTCHNSGAFTLDNSALHIELKKFPDSVKKISFVLSIYEAEERKQISAT